MPYVNYKNKQEIRIRYRCAKCAKVASWVFKKSRLQKAVVFDTTYLRCQDCYAEARAEVEQEFLDMVAMA